MKSEGTSKKKLKKALKTSTAVVLLTTAVLSVIYRLPLCFESQNPAALAAAAFTLTNGEYKLENSKTEKPTASDQKPTESADTEPTVRKVKRQPRFIFDKAVVNLSSRVAYGAFLNRVFVLAVMVAVGIVIGAFVTLVIFLDFFRQNCRFQLTRA